MRHCYRLRAYLLKIVVEHAHVGKGCCHRSEATLTVVDAWAGTGLNMKDRVRFNEWQMEVTLVAQLSQFLLPLEET